MNQIHAFAERLLPLPVARVREAVTDYAGVRSRILTPEFSGFRATPGLVEVDFQGERAELVVSSPRPDTVVEADRRSSLVFTWTTDGTGDTTSVRLSLARDGANGPLGLLQRVTAPPRLRLVLDGLLANLAAELAR
ncbi:SRPBCC family protein [Actinokineospora soli]|uniref:SRPBCC family protein n=1 Tax=Actinokineospora soli TaxID=1048753 RepID=A0ABW2TW14_9PSEU